MIPVVKGLYLYLGSKRPLKVRVRGLGLTVSANWSIIKEGQLRLLLLLVMMGSYIQSSILRRSNLITLE